MGKKANPKTWKAYATFSVTVDGKTYTVKDEKVTVTLPARGKYTVTVECDGEYKPSGKTSGGVPLDPKPETFGSVVYDKFTGERDSGDPYWDKDPSIKLNVNNWAKIKNN